MTIIPLKEVFTPGGLPSVTYVGREHLDLERKISNARAKGYAFNVVTGPTKSGKSVLCHKVLSDKPFVVVEGGQVKSEVDFWSHVGYQLNIPSSASKGQNNSNQTTTSAEASGGMPGVFGGKGSLSHSDTVQIGSSTSYTNVPILASLDKLISTDTALLVDDFHYLSPELQKTLIQSLKGGVFKGLTVFLLAVPHRAFDPITVENEVEGRFKHIEIPPWTIEDLLLIPERGFEALNVSVAESVQKTICGEAFGNPLLVQESCSEFCLLNDVHATQVEPRKLDAAKLTPAFEEIARSKGFPKFQKLKKGPQARKERQPRLLRSGQSEDIYSVVMSAIARLGPKELTTYDELRSSVREILSEGAQMPQKNEITSALAHMTKIAKEEIQGEPALEWVKDDNELVITDPFLLFYMKWSLNKQISVFSI